MNDFLVFQKENRFKNHFLLCVNHVNYLKSYVTRISLVVLTFAGLFTNSNRKKKQKRIKMITFNTKKYLFSKGLDQYFEGVHKAYEFTGLFFKEVFKRPFHLREVINQCFEVGLKSLALISLTGFIVGIVFTKQSRTSPLRSLNIYPIRW